MVSSYSNSPHYQDIDLVLSVQTIDIAYLKAQLLYTFRKYSVIAYRILLLNQDFHAF